MPIKTGNPYSSASTVNDIINMIKSMKQDAVAGEPAIRNIIINVSGFAAQYIVCDIGFRMSLGLGIFTAGLFAEDPPASVLCGCYVFTKGLEATLVISNQAGEKTKEEVVAMSVQKNAKEFKERGLVWPPKKK